MRVNALVISASLPPFNDSSTLRLIGRVRRFSEYDIVPTFIGAEMPQNLETSLLDRLPTSSTILRTSPTTYDQIMARLSELPAGKFLTWTYSNIMYRLVSPDVRTGWDKQVMGLCKQTSFELKPDIIVTSGGSHTAHMAGRQLSEHFSVPWVADLGDPWSLVDPKSWVYMVKARRNRLLELQTIPCASGLVFTTETTLTAYQEWLGDKLPQAIVLPSYGYNADDFLTPELECQQSSNKISISHIGAAHQANRNLIPTIQALSALEQTGPLKHSYVLNIIGPHSQSFEEEAVRLKFDSVTFSDRVSYQDSIDWINRSNVLIIVGNASPLQIPGKVYPNLGSGRPILYIGQLPHEQDPTARLLAQFPGVLFAENSQGSIIKALQEINLHFAELVHQAAQRLNVAALQHYESSRISDNFAEFVKKIAADTMKNVAV